MSGGMQENSLDLNLLAAHDGTASYQQAPTLPNGSPPAMRGPQQKRYRPRKSVSMPLAIMPASHPSPSANARKRVTKRRVRAPSSTTNEQGQKVAAIGSGVNGMNHKVVMIQAGEDIATKIMPFSGNEWLVCILSAHGVISNVTLRQGTSSHATITHEGYFEILSLSGTYQPSETNGMRSLTGELRVSLASPHGHVFGGGVAGALTAASPIQVVIGRIPVDDKKNLKGDATSDIPGASSSTPSDASSSTPSGSSGRPRSPLNQSASGSVSTSSHPVVSNIP